MTFPVVAASNSSSILSSATFMNVNLPANISSGDLLFIAIGWTANPGTITLTNWNAIGSIDANGTAQYLHSFYKTATGSEEATANVTWVNSTFSAAALYRITGWSGTPEKGIASVGSSTTVDGPSLAPSWGAADTLWLVAGSYDRGDQTFTAPTNYSNIVSKNTAGASGRVTIALASRQLNASSEDPGAFGAVATAIWVSNTYAIKPIIAPPGFNMPMLGM